MAFTASTALGNAILTSISTAVDAGSAAGDIQFATSGAFTTVLATITLNDPSFAAAAAKSMAIDADPALTDTVDADGTAANFRFRDSDATVAFEGTVGTSGEDINFAAGVAWLTGGTVTLSSFTLTAA